VRWSAVNGRQGDDGACLEAHARSRRRGGRRGHRGMEAAVGEADPVRRSVR
jgi:hypothetical protein